MDVQLYVYDLTRGMARTLSQSLLGIHLDAVYHTSLVFDNVEYFFGRGIHMMRPPGSTHHGRPMEIISMGTTYLPKETIMEYLDSLREVYSPESYDLFAHNCNNFTNDFGMFLVGKGIPDHITNLPKRVLDTPIGQMLKTQIDASMREITQAPVIPPSRSRPPATNGTTVKSLQSESSTVNPGAKSAASPKNSNWGEVVNITDRDALEKQLKSASASVATIFFTSSTCAPCKVAYPMFDRLAEQYPQALFVKVDINGASDIAMQYQIRATPTFIIFAKGIRQDSWSGADPALLKINVERSIQEVFPPHPHTLLRAPALQFGSLKPVTYTKTPPLNKLMAKLGEAADESEIKALRSFVEKRSIEPKDASLPDLTSIGRSFQSKVLALPVDARFAVVDLLRCAMIDPRVSGFFAEDQHTHTIPMLVKRTNELDSCPHNLRLVTIHLACNLFTSPLYVREMMQPGNSLTGLLTQLVTSSLLDNSHVTTRVAAASLAFNLSSANYRIRREDGGEGIGDSEQVELAAGILEALSQEENGDAAKALLLALGYLMYYAPQQSELADLVNALDAKSIVSSCKMHDTLAKEVASLL